MLALKPGVILLVVDGVSDAAAVGEREKAIDRFATDKAAGEYRPPLIRCVHLVDATPDPDTTTALRKLAAHGGAYI